MPPLNRNKSDSTRHFGVSNFDDSLGCVIDTEFQGDSNLSLDRLDRRVDIKRLLFIANRVAGINPAQHQIRISYRWLGITKPIADWSWIRSSTLRANLQQACVINMGNRTSTRANSTHFDHGRAHNHAKINASLCG